MSEISDGTTTNKVMDTLVYAGHSICTGICKNQTVTFPMFYGTLDIYQFIDTYSVAIEYSVVMKPSVLMEYLILMMGLWFIVWLITDWP